jgi:hypothetical protein
MTACPASTTRLLFNSLINSFISGFSIKLLLKNIQQFRIISFPLFGKRKLVLSLKRISGYSALLYPLI